MHILFLRLKPEFSWNCKFLPKKAGYTTLKKKKKIIAKSVATKAKPGEIQEAIKEGIKTC